MSTSLLRCELLHVDGRTYRALSSPAGRHPQQQQHYEEAAGWEEEEEGAAGWDGGGEAGADEAAAVPIRQEGDAFVARMHLDAEVGGRAGCHGRLGRVVASLSRSMACVDGRTLSFRPAPPPCPAAVPLSDWPAGRDAAPAGAGHRGLCADPWARRKGEPPGEAACALLGSARAAAPLASTLP